MAARISPDMAAAREGMVLYRKVGCPRCNRTGYKGRVGVFQLLIMNDEIESLAAQNAHRDEIERAAAAGRDAVALGRRDREGRCRAHLARRARPRRRHLLALDGAQAMSERQSRSWPSAKNGIPGWDASRTERTVGDSFETVQSRYFEAHERVFDEAPRLLGGGERKGARYGRRAGRTVDGEHFCFDDDAVAGRHGFQHDDRSPVIPHLVTEQRTRAAGVRRPIVLLVVSPEELQRRRAPALCAACATTALSTEPSKRATIFPGRRTTIIAGAETGPTNGTSAAALRSSITFMATKPAPALRAPMRACPTAGRSLFAGPA